MTDALDADGMTLNETIDALGWRKGDRVEKAETFNGYEIFNCDDELVGVFTASRLWIYLRVNGEIQ